MIMMDKIILEEKNLTYSWMEFFGWNWKLCPGLGCNSVSKVLPQSDSFSSGLNCRRDRASYPKHKALGYLSPVEPLCWRTNLSQQHWPCWCVAISHLVIESEGSPLLRRDWLLGERQCLKFLSLFSFTKTRGPDIKGGKWNEHKKESSCI